MKPSVRSAFLDFTTPLEGAVPHLYADVKNLVTIAIGNLVDPISMARSLPLKWSDGTRASVPEIEAEWYRVKGDENCAKLGHRYAAKVTHLRLSREDVEQVVFTKLDAVDVQLSKRFPEWERWPADAQLATLSMAWACGAAFAFPKLEAALKRRDFDTAARECKMNEAGNPGLKPRNAANRLLYTNAARVLSQGLDPFVLCWPAEVDEMTPLPSTLPEMVAARNPMLASEGIVDAAVSDYQDDEKS